MLTKNQVQTYIAKIDAAAGEALDPKKIDQIVELLNIPLAGFLKFFGIRPRRYQQWKDGIRAFNGTERRVFAEVITDPTRWKRHLLGCAEFRIRGGKGKDGEI